MDPDAGSDPEEALSPSPPGPAGQRTGAQRMLSVPIRGIWIAVAQECDHDGNAKFIG